MSDLVGLVRGMGSPLVVVLGDAMLDRYVFGRVNRISPEAPIMVLRATREEDRPGGAASVAINIVALGGRARLVGFVGRDDAGRRLRELAVRHGVGADGLVDANAHETTLKTRMVAGRAGGHQQVLRVDREDTSPYDDDDERRLLAAFEDALDGASGVVLSDYAKGALSARVAREAIRLARAAGLPVIVDPKVRDYGRYRGATIVTPNRKEAREATGLGLRDRDEIVVAGQQIAERADADAAVITLDKDGIALVRRDGDARVVSTTPRKVHDPTGAGDVVCATLGVALADGLSLDDAVLLANVAGGVEVGKVGVQPVSRDEVVEALGTRTAVGHRVVALDELRDVLREHRALGRTIVFTNGCFDILHAGHVRYLAAARAEGDLLVVGLNSDASVRRLKGESRPVNCESDRAELLASLAAVDFVVVFDDDTPQALVEEVAPDVLVKGEDYRDQVVVGRELVERRGGRVVLVPLLGGRSTTGLIDRIRDDDEQAGR